MRSLTARTAGCLIICVGLGLFDSGAGRADEPMPIPPPDNPLTLIKAQEPGQPPAQPPPTQPPPIQPPPIQPPPLQPPPVTPPPVTPPPITEAPRPSTTPGADLAPRIEQAPVAPAGAPAASVPVGTAAQVLNARDLGQFLNRSAASTAVQVQNRNSLVTDPRIRGLRSYQYLLYADSGLYNPVRLDLDTPITRFDAASVRDVIVIKGPYSVFYGPGHAVMDVATLDSPRFDSFEAHGRTFIGYQTNGRRWDGFQSGWAGDQDWGVRLTYNGLQGNDYTAGNGQRIPGSYLSHNVNWAIGLNLTPNSSIEFKGLRVTQQDVEFPGLYFDVANMDTEAYSLRFTMRDLGPMDRFVIDAWYNSTVGTGNTSGGAKQAFVQDLLAVSFNPTAFNQDAFNQFGAFPLPTLSQVIANAPPGSTPLNLFRDLSTSRFATTSLGYRVFADWGSRETGLVTTGTDLRIIGQGLQENIFFEQIAGQNLNTGAMVLPGQAVPFALFQSIPDSSSVNPGLFVSAALPFTDRWTFRSGGRMDWVRTTTRDRTILGTVDFFGPAGPPTGGRNALDPTIFSTEPGNPNTDRDFYLLAGYLQSEYKLIDGLTGVVSVGHSERPPSLTELYAAGPFIGVLQQGTSRLIGDPRLKPEKLTQFDVGLQLDTRRLKGGVSGFYGWVNDYITFDRLNSGPGLTQVVFTNTDLATLAGGELYTQIELTDWLTGFGTMTYVQGIDQTHSDRRRAANLASSRRTDPATGQFATETEPLPQIPPLDSRVGFRIHQPTPERRWQVEFSTRIVNGQNAVARSLGELTTPGFMVFTLRGYWQLTDGWLLTAGVENFGNKLYREHLDPISGNILGVSPLFRPGTNFYFGSQFTY